MTLDLAEARAFADSVAGVMSRYPASAAPWSPGAITPEDPDLSGQLTAIGWATLAEDAELRLAAGLGAIELGRRLAPVREFDRLLGGGPLAGELVRSLGADGTAAVPTSAGVLCRAVARSEPAASADGLEVRRVLELAEVMAVEEPAGEVALRAWLAASIGYLAGLGEAALDLTTAYVRGRRAFRSTLGALAPVQQHLAEAATLVQGVRLLAAEPPDVDALVYSGHAVAEACALCHQVTGAIGFTLEYSLHRHTQRARALATWNDALFEPLFQPAASAR
ncbi:MAG TPA: acyl-CoA dehydrogenase family protein [Solirubrobacteraceae bacterium]|nr:acyl-CoA dehydrogenase family protein [Solirubrobacteraceae bacterium]